MQKLLLVEDDRNLQDQLFNYLGSEGFTVFQAFNLKEAREVLRAESIELVLLDWNLPDGSGITLLDEARARAASVIFLTARQELIDKVLGLEMGAIDYITKPFEPRELIARIRTHLNFRRRAHAPSAEMVLFGDITLNKTERKAQWQGQTVELTKKEFDLLLLFLENPGKVFSRDELLTLVWGYEELPTTRTVDNHILQLRHLFSEEFFETVRGVGYRLKRMSA
jgi:DNA-binding response OmpR family regulator